MLHNVGFCYTAIGSENDALDSYRTCKWCIAIQQKLLDKVKASHVQKFVQESVKEEEEKFESLKKIRQMQSELLLKQLNKPRAFLTQNEILSQIDTLWGQSGNVNNYTDAKFITQKLSEGKQEWGNILHKISDPTKKTSIKICSF